MPARSAAATISSLSGESLLLSLLRRPSESTISSLLKTLSLSSLDLPLGLQLHSLSLKLSLSSLPFPATSLISFYSKHHFPSHALKAFDEIPHPDPPCFSAIIAALSHNRRSSQALSFFRRMHSLPLPSSIYSLSSAIRAAAELAALDQTRIFHSHAVVSGLNPNPVVSTALLAAYGKCGNIPDAQRSFHELQFAGKDNLISWNALLSAHAQQGHAIVARQLFDEMRQRNLVPDDYTFLALLGAYSNAGNVDETKKWLNSMRDEYNMEPKLEHYSCLLSVMARAGKLNEAEQFANAMPLEPDKAVWRTILSACVVRRNAEVGRRAAERVLQMDKRDDFAYVMLAKIYSLLGRKGEMARVWVRMRDEGVKKEGGRSWIEVAGKVHVFIAGDRRHERWPEIYGKVREFEDLWGLS